MTPTSGPTQPHPRVTRADAYEEGREYRGRCGHLMPCGCTAVAACCFDCTLPKCRFDAGGNLRIQLARHRKDQISILGREGLSRAEIARRLGIGLRSVYRLLK